MKAVFKDFTWTNKPVLTTHVVFVSLALLALVFAYFRLKPHFASHEKIEPLPEVSHLKKETKVSRSAPSYFFDSKDTVQSSRNSKDFSNFPISKTMKGGFIERPLFDGATVTVQASLLHEVSSNQNDRSVEAVIKDASSEMTGATLLGNYSWNFELKRMNFQFSELTTKDGRRFNISGVAIDPETRSLGAPANYSSGIASRVIGTGIGKVLSVGADLFGARILENSNDSDVVRRELTRLASDSSYQTAQDIGDEATKGLKDTQPELSLPMNTLLTIRLKAASKGGGL